MKRFSATWTMAVASAVLLTMPATGAAQTQPPSTPPATAQPPAATTPQTHTGDHHAMAQEHLRQASAALADIKTATLPAKAKTEIAEIKRRLNALERMAPSHDRASATGQAHRSEKAKATDTWGTEVAAIDKSLTTLLGPDETTGAAPAPTGTSGTTPAPGNRTAAAISLEPETRASLSEVRTHVTAFATAMAGGKSGKSDKDATEPASASDPTATSTTTQPPTSQPATSQPATSQPATSQPPATQPTATPPAQPTDPTPDAQTPATATAQPDQDAARRHLVEARNTLSALTQLPEAAQLSGEERTQVAQLISNFNELITAKGQWRESYGKVSGNITSLLGPDPAATDPTSTTGTTGAVGTSGTASADLDPAVREKLVELRRHLNEFEKAAGSGSAGAAAMSTTPSTTAPATTTPSTTPPEPTRPDPTTPATPPTTTAPATEPAPQGTTRTQGNANIMRHVAAIEAMLKSQDDSGGLTLTKAQVDELRTHWTALRQALLDKK